MILYILYRIVKRKKKSTWLVVDDRKLILDNTLGNRTVTYPYKLMHVKPRRHTSIHNRWVGLHRKQWVGGLLTHRTLCFAI